MVGHHDLLLKRSRVSVTPFSAEIYSGKIFVGKVTIPLPIPDKKIPIFGNTAPIYRNATKISRAERLRGYFLPQPPNENIFRSEEFLEENRHKIFSNNSYETVCKNVYRNKFLDVGGISHGGRFILQSIILDVVEV